MKVINFDYTDTNFTLKLLGASFLSLVLLLVAMTWTVDVLGIGGSLILVLGVPVLIFFLNKKGIKRQGTAIIHDSYSEFNLSNSTDKIVYADIKTYQVERHNGIHLKIRFKNRKAFTLQANSNFCNASQFDTFCQAFETSVQQYKTANNVDLIRKKSMFEQAWMLPFLIILSGALVGGIIFATVQEKSIPPTFYMSAAIIIPMWIGYLNARKRRQIG